MYFKFVSLISILLFINLIECCSAKEGYKEDDFEEPEVKSFIKKHDSKNFLTHHPLETLRQSSFLIRKENPFKNVNSNETKVAANYVSIKNDVQIIGHVQFRQISDMWLVEIKGVIERLRENTAYFLAITEYPGSSVCEKIKLPFNPFTFYSYPSILNLDTKLDKIQNQHQISGIGFIRANEKGIAYINYQSRSISLYDDPNSIQGKSLALFRIQNNVVLKNAEICGEIKKSVIISPVKYQEDTSDRIKSRRISIKI